MLGIATLLLLHNPSESSAKPHADSTTSSAKAKPNKKKKSKAHNDTPALSPEARQKKLVEASRACIEANQRQLYASARAYCEEALSLTDEGSEAFIHLALACIFLYNKTDEPQKALVLLDKLIASNKDERVAYKLCFDRGMTLIRLHRYEDALQTLNACPPDEADQGKHDGAIAELYMMMGDAEKAAAAYDEALAYDNKNSFAWFGAMAARMRAGRSADAKKAFLNGVAVDPTLAFFDVSFFEPEGETYFHRALLMLFSQRHADAIHDLEENLKYERRQPYRDIAQALLDMLRSPDTHDPRLATWPVLLNRVTAVAINKNAHYLAYADQNTATVWLFDTDAGQLSCRITNISNVKSMAFDDQDTLHILTRTHRYALSPNSTDYYLYENSPATVAWNTLSDNGKYIIGINGLDQLVKAPFLAPDHFETIAKIPTETQNVLLSDNAKTAFLETKRINILTDIENDRIVSTPAATKFILGMATSQNRFAIALTHGIYIFDAENHPIARLEPHPNEPFSVMAFDPTGRYLLTLNGTIAEVWDTHIF